MKHVYTATCVLDIEALKTLQVHNQSYRQKDEQSRELITQQCEEHEH